MAGGFSGKQMTALGGASGGEGLPLVVFSETVSGLAAAGSSTVLTIRGKYRIIGVACIGLAASAGATMQLSRTRGSTTNDISNAMACAVLDAYTAASSIDETYATLQAGDKLVIKAAVNTLTGRILVYAVRTEE